MIVYRQPNRLVGEREMQARKEAEERGEPRPISNIGGGRAASLSAFAQSTGTANGR